jgi:hypothetical protein
MEDLIVDIKLWGQMVGSLVWDNAIISGKSPFLFSCK